MTSFPVRRRGGVVEWLLFAATLFQYVRQVPGCILLLDGWSPMSVGERATLADIVAVGIVRRAFKSERSSDGAATYSAEVNVIDVFKGRHLVDSVPYKPENNRSSSNYTGNNVTSGVTQLQFNLSGM